MKAHCHQGVLSSSEHSEQDDTGDQLLSNFVRDCRQTLRCYRLSVKP